MKGEAVSSVVGAIMLISVAVLVMGIVILFLFSTPLPTNVPAFQGIISNSSRTVYISHEGGDPLIVGQFKIIVDGNETTSSFTNSLTGPFTLGKVMSATLPGDPGRVVIVFNASGAGETVLLSADLMGRIPYAPPGWYSSSWLYRKKITIWGSQVTGSLTDFPVLIYRSSDLDIRTPKALENGNDFVFTLSDGTTKIPHEIEYFTGNGGSLTAWVKVPTLTAGTDTVIYMYYDNPGASNQQDPANVWSNGFQSVWHLNATSTGSEAIKDSTSTGNHGTTQNSPNLVAGGKMGVAITFDSTNDYISTKTQYSNPQTFTESVWFRTTNSSSMKMFGWESQQTGTGSTNWDRHLYIGTGGYAVGGIYNVTDDKCYFSRTTSTKHDGNWHHAAMTFGSGTLNFYVDGAFVAQNVSGIAEVGTGYWRMGAYKLNYWPYSTGDDYYRGTLDEVRLSTAVRSQEWIATEFANQNNPGAFATFSTEQSPLTMS